jgi:septal ring factor EnvC (AmiA/AmiB activator)
MSDTITKKDLEQVVAALDKKIDRRFDDLGSVLETFMQQVDTRFNKIEDDIADIHRSLDRLTNTIDGFLKRLDEVESEQRARDAQFDRLVKWARKVSEKTGIPLENL